MSVLDAKVAEIEARSRSLPDTNTLTVELNAFAYCLLQLVADRCSEDVGQKFSLEQVAEQMILRELRRMRL